MISEVMWNIFDRPNAPLEKRTSLSPKSAKILEATQQPPASKRRHQEEDEESEGGEKDINGRKGSAPEHERAREKESEKERETDRAPTEGERFHSFPEGTVDAVVRLRGLPWSIKEDDIRQFFREITIPPAGVHFEIDSSGKRTGEGFARFMSTQDADLALSYDHKVSGVTIPSTPIGTKLLIDSCFFFLSFFFFLFSFSLSAHRKPLH